MTILAGKNDKSVVKIISSEDHPICYEEVNGETVDPFKIDADTLEGKSVQDIVNMVPNPDLSNVDAKTLNGKTLDEIVASAAESSVPDGKYGYSLHLKDFDGMPLSNCIVTGVSDIDSELKSDSTGKVSFSSSVGSHSIIIPAVVSPIPSVVHSNINQRVVTEVVPKSDLYGFRLHVLDASGNPVENAYVYDSNISFLGLTDQNGRFNAFNKSSTAQFYIVKGNYTASPSLTDAASSVMTEYDISMADTVYTGILNVGNSITIFGESYLVVDIDGVNATIAMNHAATDTYYGPTGDFATTTLNKSRITYENGLSPISRAILSTVGVYTVHSGVKSRMFVPTQKDLDNYEWTSKGASYRKINSTWWLAYHYNDSSSGNWYGDYVNDTDGQIYSNRLDNRMGLRPFVTIDMNKLS